MDPKDVIRRNINKCNIMQLATSSNDIPWVVTVHFYADDELNLYWSSRDSRRHSQEIASNPNAADKGYRLKPSNIILFDTKNFPENPRQELNL
jgi:uncharacterized protein YhbP (UPF0306 family)